MSSQHPAKPTAKHPSRKSTASADELTKTTRGGIELTETDLSRISGGRKQNVKA